MRAPNMRLRIARVNYVGLCVMAITCACLSGLPVQADPHPGQSLNVVIIGGSTLSADGYNSAAANVMGCTSGGYLPVTGPAGELGDFFFTAMHPADVSSAALTNFDTAVLNVASAAICCNLDTFTADQKTDIVAFVAGGKKLIIYDSECAPVDYSWLPFPFSTSNPGAQGAQGTLTIVEENTLSSADLNDVHYVDYAHLGSKTDAVGDMNVMTTLDANWCLDMSGTNILNVTGPVHTYAKYPAGTDAGLIIYNGLDQNYQWLADTWLRKIWVQELQQPFNPSNLPCGLPVVGISLDPPSATNEVGQSHTVTATLTDLLNNPQPGILVTFSVVSGPNVGASGICDPVDCKTAANGKVSWTYTSNGTAGLDEIQACFVDVQGDEVCSQLVTKSWAKPQDLPPDCSGAYPSIDELWPPNHKMVQVTILGVADPEGGPVSITITGITQDEPVNTLGDGNTAFDGSGVGTSIASLRAERAGTKNVPGNGRVYEIAFDATDDAGNTCSGSVKVCVPHDMRPGHACIDDGQIYDSTAP